MTVYKLPVSGNYGLCMVLRGYKPLVKQHLRGPIGKGGLNRLATGYKHLIEQHLRGTTGKGGLSRVVADYKHLIKQHLRGKQAGWIQVTNLCLHRFSGQQAKVAWTGWLEMTNLWLNSILGEQQAKVAWTGWLEVLVAPVVPMMWARPTWQILALS